MSIHLTPSCYKWLVSLQILQAYTIPNHSQQKLEVCYDDQLYLENGYLIAMLLKQILREHQLVSQKLAKVRKIAVLGMKNNWDIVQQVLLFLEYQMDYDDQQQCNYLSEIPSILQFLYQNYSPQHLHHPKVSQPYFHIHPSSLSLKFTLPTYIYSSCVNLLELTCLLLHRCFDITIEQCLGLLINKAKYLKSVIRKGIKQSFTQIQTIYRQLLSYWNVVQALINKQQNHLQDFMEPFLQGLLSQDKTVVKLACLLVQAMDNQQWYHKCAKIKMMKSPHTEVLQLLITKAKPNYQDTFNTSVHQLFGQHNEFLEFVYRFIPIVSKSLYLKQILPLLPLCYILQQCLIPFQSYPSKPTPIQLHLSRICLLKIFSNLFSFLTFTQKTLPIIAFSQHNPIIINKNQLSTIKKTAIKTNSIKTIPIILIKQQFQSRLERITIMLEIVKCGLERQDIMVEGYFRLLLRDMLQDTTLRQYIINSFVILYKSIKRSFPVGAFLNAYQIVTVSQAIDFQIFREMSLDHSLLEDQVYKILEIAFTYFMQINGNCFIQIILNLIKLKQSTQWAQLTSTKLLSKWTQLKIPPLNYSSTLVSHSHKFQSPNQLCKYQSFGIKRKQILSFQSYQKSKQILTLLTQRKSSQFLTNYRSKIKRKIFQINKGVQNKQYLVFLNKLIQQVRICKQGLAGNVDLPERLLEYRPSHNYRTNTNLRDTRFDQQQYQDQQEYQRQQQPTLLKKQTNQTKLNYHHNQAYQGNQRQVNQEMSSLENQGLNQFLTTQGNHFKKDNQELNIQEVQAQRKQKLLVTQKAQQNERKDIQFDSLRQFTQSIAAQEQSYPFIPSLWQAFQSRYLSIVYQQNQHLISHIYSLYKTILSIHTHSSSLIPFLQSSKLMKFLPFKEVKEFWGQKEILSQQGIWEIMVGIAGLMFGFKRQSRVGIRVVESFIRMVQAGLGYTQLSIPKIQADQPNTMHRQMVFDHKLNINKYLKWNQPKIKRQILVNQILQNQLNKVQSNTEKKSLTKHLFQSNINTLQSYFVCFEVINDICMGLYKDKKTWGFGLIEPISRIINKISSDKPYQQAKIISLNIKQNHPTQDNQLQKLQQLILQQDKPIYLQKNSPIVSKKHAIKSSKKSFDKQKPPSLQYTNSKSQFPSFSRLKTLQLKEKISKRKQNLQKELDMKIGTKFITNQQKHLKSQI